MKLTGSYLIDYYFQKFSTPASIDSERLTSCIRSAQIFSNDQRHSRPGRSNIRPSAPYKVNQFNLHPTDERAQESFLATSVTQLLLCSISMAVSLRAWSLSLVLWIVFCIKHRSSWGIGTTFGIAQSGWWSMMFGYWSDHTIRSEFPASYLLFGAAI